MAKILAVPSCKGDFGREVVRACLVADFVASRMTANATLRSGGGSLRLRELRPTSFGPPGFTRHIRLSAGGAVET